MTASASNNGQGGWSVSWSYPSTAPNGQVFSDVVVEGPGNYGGPVFYSQSGSAGGTPGAGTYSWSVRAYYINSNGTGGRSQQYIDSGSITITGTPPPPPAPSTPSTPTLSISVSGQTVNLSWNNVSSTGYQVFRDGVNIHEASGIQTTSFSETRPYPSTTTYAVRAYNNLNGQSAFSSNSNSVTAVVNRAPNTPSGIAVNPNPVNTVGTISWVNNGDPDGEAVSFTYQISTNNGASWSGDQIAYTTATSVQHDFTNLPATTSALVRVIAKDGFGAFSSWGTSASFVIQHNRAPLAATPTAPTNNTSLDRSLQHRFSWQFNDPDAGDSQSKFDLRYRVGSGAWTTITRTTTNQFYDMPAGTLATANYEWQVLTYDAQGVAATAWSDSRFVTFADVPAGPTILTPGSNSTQSIAVGIVEWSYPSHTAYQVQKLADLNGSADVNNVLFDSGEVTSTSARTHPITYPVDNRYEHVRVRIKENGLWSTWSSVRIFVSFVRPLAPALAATPESDQGRMQLLATNPTGNFLTTNQASAETDATGVHLLGGTSFVRSTAQAFDGSASIAHTGNASTAGVYWRGTAADAGTSTAVVPGQVYTAVAHVRAATVSRAAFVRFYWYDAVGTDKGFVDGPKSADNSAGWTQIAHVAQAPAGATRCTPAVLWSDSGEVHYVDAVGLFETPTGNLVPGGGGFENGAYDVAPWDAYNSATVVGSTEQAYTGRQSAFVSWNGNVNARYYNNTGLTVGQTYTASAWVYVPAGNTPVVLDIANLGGSATAPTTVTGQWVRLVKTFVCNSAANGPQVGPASTPGAGHGVYVDAVQVVVGSSPVEYVPPTTHNLVPRDPSHEAGTVTLSSDSPNTQAQDPATPLIQGSTASRRITLTSGTQLNFYRIAAADHVTVTPGWYTLSYYIWSSRGGTFRPYFYADDSLASATRTIPAQTWTRVVEPRFVSGSRVNLYGGTFDTGQQAGDYILVDGWQIEQGSVATPYVDGSLGAGYRWDASENLLSAAASSFEDGTTGGWSVPGGAGNGTVANGTNFFVGTKGLTVTPTADAKDIYAPGFTGFPVNGATYTFSAYVYSTVARTFAIGITDNVAFASSTTVSVPANTWTRITHTQTAQASSTGGGNAFIRTTSGGGNAYYIDAVQLEQRPYATPYGSTGTANASTSTRQFPWAVPPAPVASTDLLRRERGETDFQRIAVVASGVPYFDYTAASGMLYEYKAVAVGTNQTTADSPLASGVVTLRGIWLHDPTAPATSVHRFAYDAERQYTWEPEVAEQSYVGRTFPVAEYGTRERESVSLSLPLDTVEDNDVVAMEALVRRKKPLLYRDGRGRKFFALIRSLPLNETRWGARMGFTANAIDYDETI